MYSIKTTVGSSSTDSEGKLKLISALDLMQDCSQLWLDSEPAAKQYFSSNHLSQILVSRQLDVLRYPCYGEKLTTTTSIYECKAFYGYRNTVIYDETGKACFLSWSIGAFVNLETGKLTRVSNEIFEKIKMDSKIEMYYLENKIAIPDLSTVKEVPLKVRRQDIDFNRHLNNARYIDYAIEYLPVDFSIKRLRVQYQSAAKFGELLYPETLSIGEQVFVFLKDEQGKSKALIEFTK
ncbi:MAG: hypothetical protein LBU51_09880 [Bacteroidales bacterium]|jgi:acyl-ACP thioesterase|nr:hypothetical protein [Bacteroidales bacterium]